MDIKKHLMHYFTFNGKLELDVIRENKRKERDRNGYI
jgi:hypothetical protein